MPYLTCHSIYEVLLQTSDFVALERLLKRLTIIPMIYKDLCPKIETELMYRSDVISSLLPSAFIKADYGAACVRGDMLDH
jgi:hypothetical protein